MDEQDGNEKAAGIAQAEAMATADAAAIQEEQEAVAEGDAHHEQRLAICKSLSRHIGERIRDVMYNSGKLKRVTVEDPGAIEKFWAMQTQLDEAMTMHLQGKLLWDSDDPAETTVMAAARDLFVYIVLL